MGLYLQSFKNSLNLLNASNNEGFALCGFDLRDCDLLQLCRFAGRCFDFEGDKAPAIAADDVRQSGCAKLSAVLFPKKAARHSLEIARNGGGDIPFKHSFLPILSFVTKLSKLCQRLNPLQIAT